MKFKVMTTVTLFVTMSTVAVTSCLASERVIASRSAEPVVRGMELDPEIRDHFVELLGENFSNSDDISISDSGDERIVIVDMGDELRMFSLVKDGKGYSPEFTVAIEKGEFGEDVEVFAEILQSDNNLMVRAARLDSLKRDIQEGTSLTDLALNQSAVQDSTNDGDVAATATASLSVSCASNGDAICCGFQGSKGVRVICACNSGNNTWKKCFDSGWME